MHKLVIQDDEGKTTVVPLIRDEITVGRKEGNTIRLTERNVSRRHARIVRKNGTFVIEDLSSYNGVRVNGTRVQGRVSLTVSDRIQIGDYLIELKADTAAQAAESPPAEHRTQPIDRANPLESSSSGIPVAQDSLAELETRKMASAIPPMGAPAMPGAAPMPGGVTNPGAPPGAPLDPSVTAVALSASNLPAVTGTPPEQRAESALARLAVLSTTYAGREFALDKPAMVIGRTEDNDVVINHRSISRHHAKVVRENGRYAIVDLQSSNGVRVNGEDYGKVELRRADMIDLGHVRLRFVEPGEDFIFARDARIHSPGGRRGMWFGVIALVVIMGAAAAFALTRGGQPTEALSADPQQSAPSQGMAQVADASALAVTPPPPSDTIKPLLDEALEAIKQEKWDEAIAAADQALEIESNHEMAQERLAKAQAEKANQARYAIFNEAVRSKDPARVYEAFEGIDEDSVYRARAHDEYDRIGAAYLTQLISNARRLLRTKKCRDIRNLAEQAGETWPGAAEEVSKIAGECDAAVAAANARKQQATNAQGSGSKTTNPQPKPDSDEGDKPSGKSTEVLAEEAKDAYKKEQYGLALRRCKEAYSISRSDSNLMSLCGLAACNLKNLREAKRFYNATSNPDRKTFIVQKCLGTGIDVRQ